MHSSLNGSAITVLLLGKKKITLCSKTDYLIFISLFLWFFFLAHKIWEMLGGEEKLTYIILSSTFFFESLCLCLGLGREGVKIGDYVYV